MGKTRESKQTQEINPEVEKNSQANMGLARLIASLGYKPYTGNDIADFTPMQKTAMEAGNTAADAFGMPTAEYGGPTGAVDGGFSSHDVMKKAMGPEYDSLLAWLNNFAQQAGGAPKTRANVLASRDRRTSQDDGTPAVGSMAWRGGYR